MSAETIDPTTITCVRCGVLLAVDPRNLSYASADGHRETQHDPVTGQWQPPLVVVCPPSAALLFGGAA